MSEHRKDKERKEKPFGINIDFGVGNFLSGLGNLVEQLSKLAEKGEELSKLAEIQRGKEFKGVYGFNIKVGGLGAERKVRIEPFGNIRKGRAGVAEVKEVREPLIDIFDEEDHVLVVAELPGVEEKDIELELRENLLEISTLKGGRKYQKDVVLPASFPREKMSHTYRNGILEVRLQKDKGALRSA